MEHGRARVVVIDDEEDLRFLAAQVLDASVLFDVVGLGANGEDAIQLADAHRPDVVLLDLEMPWLHGAEAVPHIRRCAPDARIVLWTVSPDSARAHDALRLGAHATIDKSSCGIRGLTEALRRTLARLDDERADAVAELTASA